MFRCYFCKQITPPRTTRHSVVIETRPKQYSARRREPKRRSFRDRDAAPEDRGGQGVEIIKEVDACPKCAAEQLKLQKAKAAAPPDTGSTQDAS